MRRFTPVPRPRGCCPSSASDRRCCSAATCIARSAGICCERSRGTAPPRTVARSRRSSAATSTGGGASGRSRPFQPRGRFAFEVVVGHAIGMKHVDLDALERDEPRSRGEKRRTCSGRSCASVTRRPGTAASWLLQLPPSNPERWRRCATVRRTRSCAPASRRRCGCVLQSSTLSAKRPARSSSAAAVSATAPSSWRRPCSCTRGRTPTTSPFAFRPDRFVERRPDSSAWSPFGGGVRRCLGASLGQEPLQARVRVVLERATPRGPRACGALGPT